ncbi:MAG: hypothetical protein II998_11380 [Clostridia bacterium]|nr:hypothetical protein [Clostridia bacterium]
MNILSYILLAIGVFLTFGAKTVSEAISKNKDGAGEKQIVLFKFIGFVFVLAAVIILALTEK